MGKECIAFQFRDAKEAKQHMKYDIRMMIIPIIFRSAEPKRQRNGTVCMMGSIWNAFLQKDTL